MTQKTWQKLRTLPPGSKEYTLGWCTTARPWASGQVLNHNGSNVSNFSAVWMAPSGMAADKRPAPTVFLVCTNTGAFKVQDAIAGAIVKYEVARVR